MRKPFIYCLAFIMGCLTASAATYQHKACGLFLWLPDDWKVDIDRSALSASSPDDAATLQVILLEGAADFDAAFGTYPAVIRNSLTAYRETQARRDSGLNGMTGIAAGGEGIQKGARKSVRVTVFKGPRGFVLLVWLVPPQQGDPYRALYDQIASSIKAIVNRGTIAGQYLWEAAPRRSPAHPAGPGAMRKNLCCHLYFVSCR